MRNRLRRRWMVVMTGVAAVVAVVALSVARPATQGTRVDRIDGRPNFSGIWQANNEANWDLQAHEARAGAVMQPGVYPYDFAQVPAAPSLPFGAAGGVPGSLGVCKATVRFRTHRKPWRGSRTTRRAGWITTRN